MKQSVNELAYASRQIRYWQSRVDQLTKASDAIAKASDAKASDAIAKKAKASDAIAKKAKASDAIASDATASLPQSSPGKNLKTDANRAFSAKVVITSVFDDNGKLRGYFVEIPKVLPISSAQPNEGQKPMSTELSTGGDDKLSTMGQSEGVLPAKSKEKGEEREKLSPCTPYKRERRVPKENEEEEGGCARACEASPTDRETLIAKVAAFNREQKANIDPAYFVDYYLSRPEGWPRRWRSRFQNWIKNPDQKRGRISPKDLAKQAGTAPAVKLDWTLCAERCKSCTGDGCKRGYLIPPACHPEHPRPPEECPKFTAKEA